MALNIKNREINEAARELASLTGESMSEAVTLAVKERLRRLQREQGDGRAERLLQIGNDCAAHMKEPFLSVDHADLLYDEQGLPR